MAQDMMGTQELFDPLTEEAASIYNDLRNYLPEELEGYVAQGANYYVFGSQTTFGVTLKLPLVTLDLDERRSRVRSSASALELAAGRDNLERLVGYTDGDQPMLATWGIPGSRLGNLTTEQAAMPVHYYPKVFDTLAYMHTLKLAIERKDWHKTVVSHGFHFLDFRIGAQSFKEKLVGFAHALATLPRVSREQRAETARTFSRFCYDKVPADTARALADTLKTVDAD